MSNSLVGEDFDPSLHSKIVAVGQTQLVSLPSNTSLGVLGVWFWRSGSGCLWFRGRDI